MITADQIKMKKEQDSLAHKKNKTLFVTLPQRDTPGTFPPYGALTVMSYLKKKGYTDIKLYNIDLLRPSDQEAIDYIVSYNPELLCISAPVSTAYENCKTISLAVRQRLPHVKIILGGNLAASAEIILKKTAVDICVLGEGEIAGTLLFDHLSQNRPFNELYKIKGLGFLSGKGEFVNTGHADQLPMEEVYDIDWNVWDEQSFNHSFRKLKQIDPKSMNMRYYTGINGQVSAKQLESRIAIFACSKGCVARCTFCHRWQKGIRYIPVEILMGRMKLLMERYGVGIFNILDECFGADLKWLYKFCEAIKSLDVIWVVAGMRVKQITPEIISMMKDAGCRGILYGMETGSARVIEIMEKRASIEDNERAFKLTLDAGLQTIPQLIIGMPGENHETIEESAEFIARNMVLSKYQNPREVSINYAQALPGTPLYEYARHKGMIGESIDDEEKYLLHISDRDACDDETTLNFTEFSRLTLVSWRNIILAQMKYRYAKAFGMAHYYKVLFPGGKPGLWSLIRKKDFGLILDLYPKLTYSLRSFMVPLKFIDIWKKRGARVAFGMLWEHIAVNIKRLYKKSPGIQYKSLRKIVENDLKEPFKGSETMVPLRMGR